MILGDKVSYPKQSSNNFNKAKIKKPYLKGFQVVWGGIEPPTQGFSELTPQIYFLYLVDYQTVLKFLIVLLSDFLLIVLTLMLTK